MSQAAVQSRTIETLMRAEAARFTAEHPRSIAMAAQAAKVWRGGVPMHWMGDWACPSPIFAAQGVGAQITDIDGKLYDDFCLGDTPSMFGHGDAAVASAVAEQIKRGAGFMLPTASSIIVGRLLAESPAATASLHLAGRVAATSFMPVSRASHPPAVRP